MRRALSLRIHVLFNLRCLMKPMQKIISCEIFTDVKASRDKFPSLFSTLYRIRKVRSVPFIPPVCECKELRGLMGSITGRILKNPRATISKGNYWT